jgi:hypothetical protein
MHQRRAKTPRNAVKRAKPAKAAAPFRETTASRETTYHRASTSCSSSRGLTALISGACFRDNQ